MHPFVHRIPRLLALLLALALFAAACGEDGGAEGDGEAAEETAGETQETTEPTTEETGEDVADETETETEAGGEASGDPITIGGIFDLSGATGDVGTPYAEGVRAYVDWRNSEMNGAGGRPINLVSQDYAYDVAVAEQLYSQFVSEGAVAMLGWGTGDTEALRGRVAADEVPFVSGSYSEALVDTEEAPYNFIVVATYSDQMRIALKHIAEEDPGAQVAVFHHDSPFGTSPVADGEAYIDEAGLDIGGYEAYPMPAGATDYVSQLTQAQSQGATWVVIQNVGSPAAQLVSNIDQQGLDMNVVCLNWCASEILVNLAGDAAEGVIGVMPYTPPTGEAEGLDVIREYVEGQGETLEEQSVHFVQGWYKAHVIIEAIANVVESGEEVTGAAIKESLETNTFDTGGVTPEVQFSADSHRGVTGAPLYQVEGGQWTQLTEPIEP